MKNLFNVLVVAFIVFFTGCAPKPSADDIPDIIKANMISTPVKPVEVDITPASLPPDVAQGNTILISDTDGCKTYMVTGETTYLSPVSNKWISDWYKTYFTKCSDSNDVVNEWDIKQGKQTIRQTSVTKRVTNK